MADGITAFAVDDMWGTDCAAYHLQFRPDDGLATKIVELQDSIESRIDHLRRVPPEALHMTVVTLVLPTTDKLAVERMWTRVGPRCIEAASRLSASCGPIPVEWNTVRAYDKAIVLMGEAHPRLQSFRAEVVDAVSEADFRPSPPRIAHITLFRYADIDPRLVNFARPCGPIKADMREIRLTREDRYPSLALEVLRRWRL